MKKQFIFLVAVVVLLITLPVTAWASPAPESDFESDAEDSSYASVALSAQTGKAAAIDAPDYHTWLANTLLYGVENSGNGLYTTFQSLPDPVYMELGGYLLDDVPLVSVSTAWSVYFNSEYRNQFLNEQKYIYEVILMEYLKYDSGYVGVKNELINNEINFSMKLYKTIAKELSDNTLDYIKDMTVEEAIDFYEKTEVLDKMKTAISELQSGVDNVKDLINTFSEYMALQQVREDRVYLLKAARDACAASDHPNTDFIKAANELIGIIEGSDLQYIRGKSLDYLWGQICDCAWGTLCDKNPILKSIELGVSGLDVCFDSTDVASNNLKLALLYTTDHYLKQGMMSATSDFMGNDSPVHAQTFLACFQAYVQFQMYGNDFAKTWLNGYLDSGAVGNVINMIFYRENISTAKEMIERSDTQTSNRKTLLRLIDKYANMYQRLYEDSDWKEWMSDTDIHVTGVNFSNPQVTLNNKNSIFSVYANIEPADATNKNITYTSSDPSILSVPENGGFAEIKGSGTVTVEAKTEEGEFVATQTVTIGTGTSIAEVDSGSCGRNARWTLFENGTLYIYGSGEMDDYDRKDSDTLAPWVTGKNKKVVIEDGITSIGDCAFYGCNNLSRITLPSSVTSIGNCAFEVCSNLGSITIPSSVTSIGDGAFGWCSKLSSITIPSSVTSIGDRAFGKCSKLSSITIPPSVTSIGEWAFWECSNLSSIAIPSSVTSIGVSAFNGCSKLSSIAIPSSVTSIGEYAFAYCSKLSSITIPSSVTSIGKGVFCNCSNLSSIKVDSENKKYDSRSDCNAVIETENSTLMIGCKNTIIPSSVTSIGEYAFVYCSKLSSITIPSSVTSIGDWAFERCSNLGSITIPSSVTSIGSYAFCNCSKLSSIAIPSSVTSIGDGAFGGCSNLGSITIPSSVTNIGSYAFRNCSNLSSIAIPSSVISIGYWAFGGCSNLGSITIPSSVTSIGEYAFYDCYKLSSITIPTSVTSIGEGTFYDCRNLSSITIPTSVTSIADNAFESCDKSLIFYVQADSHAEEYAKKNEWKYVYISADGETSSGEESGGDVNPPENQETTTQPPAKGDSQPSKGDVSDTVADVNQPSDGTPATLPTAGEKLTDIKTKAVYAVTKSGSAVAYAGTTDKKAVSLSIPATVKISGVTYKVKSVEKNALKNNKKLQKVTISGNVSNIGASAFQGCSALKTVKMGSKVTAIGDKAFSGCKKLSSLTIGKNVSMIGKSAFQNCAALKKVTIPAKVKKIGASAFSGCKKLTGITVKSQKLTEKNVGSKAFAKAGSSNYKKMKVTVPAKKYAAYKKLLKKKGLSGKAKVVKK